MSYAAYLLTAACLTAAPPDAPVPMAGATQTIQVTSPDAPPPAPRLFDRIRGLFGRRAEAPAATIAPDGKAQLGTPVNAPIASGAGVPTVAPGTVAPGNALSGKDLEMAGHEKDYSWITGRVYRADGGRWVLRYAAPHEVDSHGGSVLLTPKPGMPTLHEGDLVCVHGKVIGGRVPRGQAGAVYDVSEINVITGVKR
jgi:hypothetical protein